MLVRARGRLGAQQRRLAPVVGDAFALPFRDRTFPLVVATRFLHLWPDREQRRILAEMTRVLTVGGHLVVDFDNWSHRTFLSGAIAVYQWLRGAGRQVSEHYNRIRATATMLEGLGLRVDEIRGVGGYHLIAAAWLSHRLGIAIGRRHARPPLRWLAEQFVVSGCKV